MRRAECQGSDSHKTRQNLHSSQPTFIREFFNFHGTQKNRRARGEQGIPRRGKLSLSIMAMRSYPESLRKCKSSKYRSHTSPENSIWRFAYHSISLFSVDSLVSSGCSLSNSVENADHLRSSGFLRPITREWALRATMCMAEGPPIITFPGYKSG